LNKSLLANLNTFNWIGNVDWANQVVITWHNSPIQTVDDAVVHESSFGSAGAGSISTQVPAMLNSLVGTRFKIVMGYPGPGNLLVAMERGEVDATLFTWAAIKSLRPDYVTQHLINIITQVGLKPDDELPNVPLMRDLAKTPSDRAIMDYLARSVAVGRPVATTPDVPAERVAALRQAFDDTLKDPEFVEDARRQHLEIMAMSGADLQQIVKGLVDAPPDLLADVRKSIQVTQGR
jgi:tripartite-type tricarboxylate transporter receptor subunit TctC